MARAPVYRNLEAEQTVLGLAFPSELVLYMAYAWGVMLTLSGGLQVLMLLAGYVALRLVTYGKPPLFIQHWVNWKARQWSAQGVVSAAARSPAPLFPFAPHVFRDVPPVGLPVHFTNTPSLPERPSAPGHPLTQRLARLAPGHLRLHECLKPLLQRRSAR